MTKIDFQPMPKRFMVWDKVHNIMSSPVELAGLPSLRPDLFDNTSQAKDNIIVVQSTNLFDKDGKEIFEGSILETMTGVKLYVFQEDHKWVTRTAVAELSFELDEIDMAYGNYKAIGHILSNPELMEESSV